MKARIRQELSELLIDTLPASVQADYHLLPDAAQVTLVDTLISGFMAYATGNIQREIRRAKPSVELSALVRWDSELELESQVFSVWEGARPNRHPDIRRRAWVLGLLRPSTSIPAMERKIRWLQDNPTEPQRMFAWLELMDEGEALSMKPPDPIMEAYRAAFDAEASELKRRIELEGIRC